MALFSLSEFKTHEGIVGSDLDAVITQLISAASAYFDKSTKRKLESATYTEDYSGTGDRVLSLRHYPVTALTSISVSADRTFPASSLIPAGDYVLDKEAGLVTQVSSSTIEIFRTNPVWSTGRYNIRVVYTAGYTTVPEDLKEAAIVWASWKLAKRGAVGLTSETIGSHSRSFNQGSKLPVEIAQTIKAYSRGTPYGFDVRDAT